MLSRSGSTVAIESDSKVRGWEFQVRVHLLEISNRPTRRKLFSEEEEEEEEEKLESNTLFPRLGLVQRGLSCLPPSSDLCANHDNPIDTLC